MASTASLFGLTSIYRQGGPSWLKRCTWHVRDHFVPHARNDYHPHIFGHRATALLSVALVSLKIFSLAALTFGPVVPAFSSAITPANIIALTNQSRAGYNMPALTHSSLLAAAAQAKAADMLAKGYFSHNTPDGKTPWDFIKAAGYNYLSAGENLAVNFTEAENVEAAWMNSPGHKANILNAKFEEIGVGIAQGQYEGHDAIFVVQMFGLPVEQKVTLQSAPTKVQTADIPAPAVSEDQVLGDVASVSSNALAAPVVIKDTKIAYGGDAVTISAQVDGPAVKVLAYFGREAIALSPKEEGQWSGSVEVSRLAALGQASVTVKAYDIRGAVVEAPVMSFSGSTLANYNVVDTARTSAKTSFMGRVFDPRQVSERLYVFLMAGMLGGLCLAVGIKKHIQHVSVIANGSFVIILASLLWMTG